MDSVDHAFVRTAVGPRGRMTIPVAIQRAAGIHEGGIVVIRVEGPGVLRVETPDAIHDRIRASAASANQPEDATSDLRRATPS